MKLRSFLFAKQDDPTQGPSGGRGPDSSPAAVPTVAGGDFLPLDHASFRRGQHVLLNCKTPKGNREVKGFKDPCYDDWRDAAGNPLDPALEPIGWKAL